MANSTDKKQEDPIFGILEDAGINLADAIRITGIPSLRVTKSKGHELKPDTRRKIKDAISEEIVTRQENLRKAHSRLEKWWLQEP